MVISNVWCHKKHIDCLIFKYNRFSHLFYVSLAQKIVQRRDLFCIKIVILIKIVIDIVNMITTMALVILSQ